METHSLSFHGQRDLSDQIIVVASAQEFSESPPLKNAEALKDSHRRLCCSNARTEVRIFVEFCVLLSSVSRFQTSINEPHREVSGFPIIQSSLVAGFWLIASVQGPPCHIKHSTKYFHWYTSSYEGRQINVLEYFECSGPCFSSFSCVLYTYTVTSFHITFDC